MSLTIKPSSKFVFLLIYIIIFTILTIPFSSLAGQSSAEENHELKNQVFNKNIKTVLLNKTGFEMSEPIIQLQSGEKLLLSFDDLDDAKVKNFKYTIQHCEANWCASDLLQNQYIEGYPEDYINDYEFSLNTTVPYIHYTLKFPNDYLRLTKSGNYVIKVFEDDEQNLVFIRRFKVIDPQINIDARVRPAERFIDRDKKQEIGFSIFRNNLYIQNPERDLIVVVQQNGRQDNLVSNLKPIRNLGDELDYNFNQKTIFFAGNEFRNFDIKSLKYRSEYIKQLEYFDKIHHVFLWEEQSKAKDVYHFEYDINGQRLIRNTDGIRHEIEADYCWVYFFVAHKFVNIKGGVYIMGELTDWQFEPENKLTYNFERQGFEGKLLLKQGYYNYQYVLLNDTQSIADFSFLEGNHFETTNDYTIYVYYQEPGTYYHQLIGYQKFSAPN